jgi:hypothetical protein
VTEDQADADTGADGRQAVPDSTEVDLQPLGGTGGDYMMQDAKRDQMMHVVNSLRKGRRMSTASGWGEPPARSIVLPD